MQEYLALIESPYQIEFLKKWFGENPQRKELTKVIALNLEGALLLEKESIFYYEVDSFLSTNPLKLGYFDAYELALKMKFFFGTKNFYEKALFPDYWAFFRNSLICENLIQQLLSQHKSHCVLLFPAHRVLASLWDHQAQAEGLFDAILRYYIKTKNHPNHSLKQSSFLKSVKESLRLLSVILDQIKNTFKKSVLPFSKIKSDTDILFCDWGFDFYRHMEFEKVENSKFYKDLKLAHLCWRGVALESKRSSLIFPVTLRYPNFLIFIFQFWFSVVFRKLFLFFFNKSKRKKLNYPFIFFNRYMRFYFIRFFLVHYCHIYLSKKYIEQVFKLLKLRLLVCSDVDYSFHRALILLAQQRNILVVSTNHGCYDHLVFKEQFLADSITVWGNRIQKNLLEAGVVKEKIKVVGNSLYSNFHAFQESKQSQTVMILASHFADSWSERIGAEARYKKVIEDLCNYLCHQMKTKVLLKSHPGGKDIYFFYDYLEEKYQPYLKHINQKGPFQDLLKECHLVVLPGVTTTAILECLMARKPIIYHGGVLPLEKEFLCDIDELGLRVESLQEFQQMYSKIISDEKFKKTVIDRGSDYLISCTNLGQNSIENLNQWLVEILKKIR